MKHLLYVTLALFVFCRVDAQVSGVQKLTNPKRQSVVDSLKNTPYPFVFPILGDKVRKRGLVLPLPHGIMLNYLQGTQLVQLSNLMVGFNHGTMYDLDEVVTFQEAKANIATPNIRLDTWILPFMNISGMAGYALGTMKVHMSEPADFSTETDIKGQYYGIGAMFTGAIGPVFVANDYNYTWNFNDKLTHPATIFMTGLRAGPVFRFKDNARMNISIWSGFVYSYLNSGTEGSINFSEVFPDAGADLDTKETQLTNWYTEAYADAKLPSQKEAIQAVYDKSMEGINRIRDGVETGSIQYSMQKKIERPFNVLAGAQWQINDTWQLRTELQLFGDRQTFLASVNYRFGIKGKTLFSKAQ